MGMSQRKLQRAMHRVKAIAPALRDRIRDHPEIADNGVELDALAAMEPAQQRNAVELVKSRRAAGIRDAQKPMKPKAAKVPEYSSGRRMVEREVAGGF